MGFKRGCGDSYVMVMADYAPLYPPYALDSRFRGVQRGAAPLRFFLSPKSGGLKSDLLRRLGVMKGRQALPDHMVEIG